MIGIKAVASWLPEQRIDNLARATEFASTAEQISERIGFTQVAVKNTEHGTLDLAAAAVQKLLEKTGLDPAKIQALIVVTQNPDRNIPHVSAELHGRFKLDKSCACFDVGLGCSGYVYALSVLKSFMDSNGLENGVIVTADPYSKVVDPNDKATALIFGDGASATWLGNDPVYDIGKFTFGTMGEHVNQLATNDGVLFMNGRAVFNFAATHVPQDIKLVAEKNGTELGAIDRFVLHQGSRFIVSTIAERLEVPVEKVPFPSASYGNTVSSSIPMILDGLFSNQEIKTIALCGFGLGFSWSSTLLHRKP